jgi:ubiquinone/menaquinone biosynthesis C-methylase UbiE
MGASERPYLSAAGRDWLLPFYDPFVRLLGLDAVRKRLIEDAALQPGDRVLDIGCGTGTFLVLLKRLHPAVQAVGLDPDLKALARAELKSRRAGLTIALDKGFADHLPYSVASFDHVFSSFMLHHLPAEQRVAALREARRVLKPRGAVHVVDFGGSGPGPRGILAHLFHAGHRLKENFGGRIAELMTEAGLFEAREVDHRRLFFGDIAYYRAMR